MKRINVLAVFLIGLMIFVTSFAVAQDSALETNTPQTVEGTEQPPVVDDPVEEAPAPTESRLLVFIERVFPWLMATFMTLLVIGGVLGREAIVTIGRSAPAVGREAIISAGESLIGSLERGAATTEITLDDAAVAELKKLFVSIVEDIRASEAKSMMLKQMATQEAAESSIATPDPWKLQYPADHMGSHG